MRLAATTVFDYPSPATLAGYLLAEATASGASQRVAVKAQASEEPIAIVGMACRYPGGSTRRSSSGAARRGPRRDLRLPHRPRLGPERLPRPRSRPPRQLLCTRGRLHRRPDRFDAEFFGISPREATTMDARSGDAPAEAFIPSFPIASASWSSGTTTVASLPASSR